MDAILIQTDHQGVSLYMIFILLSFVVGLMAAFLLMIKDKVPMYVIWSSIVLNALMIAFGGMLLSVLASGFKSCGLSSVGGAVGVFAAIFTIARIMPAYREQIFKAYGCIIPLMYSVSKLACHFTGCCYGREYDGVFRIHYEGMSERIPTADVFPVQMSETILFAIIFVAGVVIVYVKKAPHGIFVLASMCAIGKLMLDYLRDSHAANMLAPSLNQILCVAIMAVGALLAYNTPVRNVILGVKKSTSDISQ